MTTVKELVNSTTEVNRDLGMPHYEQHIFDPVQVSHDHLAEIFTPQQILGLASTKIEVRNGDRSDVTQEQKRLNFAAWMYDQGIIKS